MKTFRKALFSNPTHLQIALYLGVLIAALTYGLTRYSPAAPDLRRQAIDEAVFEETEFFGSTAFVPFPAAAARDNLARLLAGYPDDAEILAKIAALDESLGRFKDAEQTLTALGGGPPLAAFYGRRGEYRKQAETIAARIAAVPFTNRPPLLKELFAVARRHALKDFLSEEFFARIAEENAVHFAVIGELIGTARADGNHVVALRLIDRFREDFPANREFFLLQKAGILAETGRANDAEQVFTDGFDPFWSDATKTAFDEFLDTNNRLNAYRTSLKRQFRGDPANFQVAMRLIYFESADGNDVGPIIDAFEAERRRRSIVWTPEELLTVARLLVGDGDGGDGERAARFLYTLSLRPIPENDPALRRRVLYELFRIIVLAEDNSLALSGGDLGFFENAAKADTRPGLATGFLSLIFSDARLASQFAERERVAVKIFNRAAAQRIFDEFKKTFPATPELAQMYVDLIRLQTAARNLEIARELLLEFDRTKVDFDDFPDAAVKLAEAFFITGDAAREREIYGLLLDHLGESAQPKFPRLEGATIVPQVSYADILDRLVASFTRAKMRDEIAALYTAEMAKYPNDPQLTAQFTEWFAANGRNAELGEIHRRAIDRFPERTWRDIYARWLINEKRTDEFERFAADAIENFDVADTRDFLTLFIDNRALAGTSPDGRLYAAMYAAAHRRFPHDITFVKGLLRFYRENKLDDEWRKLAGRYFFESAEIRALFLDELARTGTLRRYFEDSLGRSGAAYRLLRAEAATRFSDFETAFAETERLAAMFPQYREFTETSVALGRSLGQTDRTALLGAASLAARQSDEQPADAAAATRSGEIYAELGDYDSARRFWHRIRETATGDNAAHLETAAVFWDYFQFDEALAAILTLREKRGDPSLFAFEAGAVFESKGDRAAAIAEYLKVLESPADQQARRRAISRLEDFVARDRAALNDAFARQQAVSADPFRLAFNFSDVFFRAGDRATSVKILRNRVRVETSGENLAEARQFFRETGESEGLRETLGRIAETAGSPRERIASRVQLAETHRATGELDEATRLMESLLRDYSSNYGVIKEVESFFWETGRRARSLAILRSSSQRATGKYRYRFTRKLARRLVAAGQTGEATDLLKTLAARDPLDSEVFTELTELYVRADQATAIKNLLDRNIAALKAENPGTRELMYVVNDLRGRTVRVFTRLRRFDLAAAQYVEMINLAPDDEALLEAALAFAERYGGTDSLIAHYETIARENYKNHRWNIVLARLYAARGDLGKAIENYRAAIFIRPETTEYREELAELLIKSDDFAGALVILEEVVELRGEDENLIRRRAFLFERLGRRKDAENELAKLPAPDWLPTVNDDFRNAAAADDPEVAAVKFREAFARLREASGATEIRAREIEDYFGVARQSESFADATAALADLRERLQKLAADQSSPDVRRAAQNLKVLETAMTGALATAVRTTATADEIAGLQGFLRERLSPKATVGDARYFLSVAVACGFHSLEESFYLAEFERVGDDAALRQLLSFYRKRGDSNKILEMLAPGIEKRSDEFVNAFAANARLLGRNDAELDGLRILFGRNAVTDESPERYFSLLYDNDRPALDALTDNPAHRAPALVRFLLTKGDAPLALRTVRNSALPERTKRRALIAINRFAGIRDADAETVFADAGLNESIGGLAARPRETSLVPPEWFEIGTSYREFLVLSGRPAESSRLTMIQPEFAPRDAAPQFAVGFEFQQRGDFLRAAEHYELALELADRDDEYLPFAGAAHFGLGETDKALEYWSRLNEPDATAESVALYVRTLNDFGLGIKARNDVRPRLVRRFGQDDSESRGAAPIVAEIAKTFADDRERSEFFERLAADAPRDRRLARQIIEDRLVSAENLGVFYEMLIERSPRERSYETDYRFEEILREQFDERLAEAIYDIESEFAPEEPESERLAARQDYLSFLIERRDYPTAAKVVRDTADSISGRYARPLWLRLADWRIRLASGDDARVANELRSFIAIDLPGGNETAALPKLERLNTAETLLSEANKPALRNEVRAAFYGRLLAVGQYETTNFVALARERFAGGEAKDAIALLNLATAMPAPEAKTEVAALPFVKDFADRDRLPFEDRDAAPRAATLTAAAKLAAEFGELNVAADYRRKLAALLPADRSNLIELARIDASLGRNDAAAGQLASIAADRSASRKDRWRALLAAEEIARTNEPARESIDRATAATPPFDAELTEARRMIRGAAPSAVAVTAEMRFLQCALARTNRTALVCLAEPENVDSTLAEIFGPFATIPSLGLIDDQLTAGADRAAISLAGSLNLLGTVANIAPPGAAVRFPTLEQIAETRRREDLRRILPALALAAERIGDTDFTIQIETARLKIAPDETAAINARIGSLREGKATAALTAARLPQF